MVKKGRERHELMRRCVGDVVNTKLSWSRRSAEKAYIIGWKA
jgi:hypothetical protein